MTHVLIVDDNAENLYLLRSLLEASRYVVTEARDGAEALTLARRDPPDLAISDLLMPVVDGFSLLRHWRDDERLKGIPFVVYTATYTEPRDERLAMALGADAFFVKPAEPEAIVEAVRALLAKRDRGELASARELPRDASALLQEYNEVLVRKLEKKALQFELANQELRAEIGQRRRAEAQLRESEERFRATFEQAAVGIAHVGVDGHFLRVNDKLCEMTGFARAELLAATCFELTVPEDRAAGSEARRAMLDGAQAVHSAEMRYQRKGGGELWCTDVTTLVRSTAGEPEYFITVIVDLTDRKRLEEQLRRAQKLEAVGRLAGGVAHDFNNLLTVINGCAELLLGPTGVGAADRDVVHAIRDAGERGAALTQKLLGFSRQSILQPRVLDLNALVTDTAQLIRRLIGAEVALTTRLAPDAGRVKVDPSQLDQVLMNLAVNARDAMPTGGRLTIETANVVIDATFASAHLEARPGEYVLLAMTDTGCGMSPEVLARIFEPFFTTKEVGKGTGLGLAMVFGIVRQSGGFVHVDSGPERGTTFRIYLPAVREPLTPPRPEATGSETRGSETILLVEDEAAVRALAARILETFGYKVVVATDGLDALKVVESHAGALDLVLTDISLPNLSGLRLAANLRARFPRLKVLFMSGYSDDAVVRDGLGDAEVAFIQKPYTASGLAQKVRQVLDRQEPDEK